VSGSLAIVTGAASGIGRAVALELARQGAGVVGADLDESGAEKTAAECAEISGRGWAERCDVADYAAVTGLAERVTDAHGIPDILVNNAGVGMTGRLTDMGIEDWRWIRSINLDGVVHGCHAFGPAMLARGSGHVVNMSSGLAYTMRATEPAYVTTKAAVLALSRCLQADWAAQGVGVTAVCPGVINTPIIAHTRIAGPQASERRRQAERVFRRGHRPETVAKVVVDAIRRNRPVAAAGWEARLGWALNRVLPVAVAQVMAAQGGNW